jgi:malto-oligosyltrehalose trehalohydrolase
MSDAAVVRAHDMPFGAWVDGESVRFRLWAPAASSVELLTGEDDAPAGDLGSRGGGWWETVLPLGAGTRYRYRIDGNHVVPDPASRHQPMDVHGPSEVIDPHEFRWSDADWAGRPWEQAVVYELHAGAIGGSRGFDGVRERLDWLAHLGVTAIELMPLSDFPGRRNWGYDGVLPFAPHSSYGRPETLKRLVAEAHERGLMVLLDVVYNHFGPEGNYLHLYAPPFFNPRARTPWGDAINLDGRDSETVRDFFVHNALYWLEEYHLDGLRIDAVHALHDASSPSFLDELAQRVRRGPGAERHVHLVLENHGNEASLLERRTDGGPHRYDAQWNDDAHHALHVLLTGEASGYYAEFAAEPVRHLARALAEGFAWQGEVSPYTGAPRGEASGHLPPTAFVNFLQNHDQIGNRAFGERLSVLADPPALEAAAAVLLLAPAVPMLFMGEEFGCRRPFPFFCDFGPELARAVTEGRRREFERFPEFRDASLRERIPDPNAVDTFERAVLDWDEARVAQAVAHAERYRELLGLRRREIVPRLAGCRGGRSSYQLASRGAFKVEWRMGDGSLLSLVANLGPEAVSTDLDAPGRTLWRTPAAEREGGRLAPWSVAWLLEETA